MDTEVTFDQRLTLSSATSGDAEEFSGRYNVDTAEQIQHASLDDDAKSSDATADAQLLAEQFAGTLYFATRAADDKGGRRSPYRRPTGSSYGAESMHQGPDAPDHRQTRVSDRVLKGSRARARPTRTLGMVELDQSAGHVDRKVG